MRETSNNHKLSIHFSTAKLACYPFANILLIYTYISTTLAPFTQVNLLNLSENAITRNIYPKAAKIYTGIEKIQVWDINQFVVDIASQHHVFFQHHSIIASCLFFQPHSIMFFSCTIASQHHSIIASYLYKCFNFKVSLC